VGGRGQNFYPKGSKAYRAKVAKIANAKIKDYLLHPEKSNGKYRIFNAIGYNYQNWRKLERDLRKGLREGRLQAKGNAQDGTSLFSVTMDLGIGVKRSTVTIWAVKDKRGRLHFVTAY